MSDNKLPEGFTPISPDSDFGKLMEKFKGVDLSQKVGSQINYEMTHNRPFRQMEEHNREMERMVQTIQKERERKEASEEACRQENLRLLKAIEQSKNMKSGVQNMTTKQKEKMCDYISRVNAALSSSEVEEQWKLFSTLNSIYGDIIPQVRDLYIEASEHSGLLERNIGVVMEVLENYSIDHDSEESPDVQNETVGKPIIFLSHRGTDTKYGHALRNLLIGLGIKRDQLIYTSHELHKIPGGMSIFEYLQVNIRRDVFMLILWSNDYLNSIPCLCEMGACWVTKCNYWHMFTPDFDFKNPKLNECPLDMQKIGATLNGDAMCKANMRDLKRSIVEMFNLEVDEDTSSVLIDNFIDEIRRASQ